MPATTAACAVTGTCRSLKPSTQQHVLQQVLFAATNAVVAGIGSSAVYVAVRNVAVLRAMHSCWMQCNHTFTVGASHVLQHVLQQVLQVPAYTTAYAVTADTVCASQHHCMCCHRHCRWLRCRVYRNNCWQKTIQGRECHGWA